MTSYADVHGPQVAVLIGSNRRQSIPIFRRVARLFEDHFADRVHKVRHGAGTEEVELVDGSIFKLLALSESAGHGLSIDLAIVDEIWDVKEDVVKQGLLPATRARPAPQLLMASTAGTEASSLMMEYRERGLRQIADSDVDDPFLFCEYSPPEDADRDDPETWAWANPALGRTITRDVIEAEHKDPDQSAFDRAVLNRWVRSTNSWLRSGLWAAGETDIEADRAPDVAAVETDRDFTAFGAVSAWSSDEGDACLVRSFATADP